MPGPHFRIGAVDSHLEPWGSAGYPGTTPTSRSLALQWIVLVLTPMALIFLPIGAAPNCVS